MFPEPRQKVHPGHGCFAQRMPDLLIPGPRIRRLLFLIGRFQHTHVAVTPNPVELLDPGRYKLFPGPYKLTYGGVSRL